MQQAQIKIRNQREGIRRKNVAVESSESRNRLQRSSRLAQMVQSLLLGGKQLIKVATSTLDPPLHQNSNASTRLHRSATTILNSPRERPRKFGYNSVQLKRKRVAFCARKATPHEALRFCPALGSGEGARNRQMAPDQRLTVKPYFAAFLAGALHIQAVVDGCGLCAVVSSSDPRSHSCPSENVR
jgi:hypothetical protein